MLRTPASIASREASAASRIANSAAPQARHAAALPLLVVAVAQSRSPAVADIIGARRVCTALMISSGSILCR
jgi:hypothetical protein